MNTFTTTDFALMKQFYFSRTTISYDFRIKQLRLLKKAIQQYESEILEALFKDLKKSKEEAFATEVGFLYAEISHAVKHLRLWMEPQKVSTPFFLFPGTSKIIRDSLGVVLIIAPWNYSFQLLIAPLIGAIAGGNCAVMKPSEITPNTSNVVVKMIAEYFGATYISVVEGDGAVIVPQIINDNRFDHIFFTGSIAVGKEIAKLAASQLVPVTLELGGKSPCIIDEDANIAVAAKRIIWGKFTNVGQTCVAPDYLLVHEKIESQLITEMKIAIHQFYGDNPQESNDYGRIINKRRYATLNSFLQHGDIIEGGTKDENDLYIAPTILSNVAIDSPIMQEEIFGPILPIITFKNDEEAFAIIQLHPNPLSLYYFGSNKKQQQKYTNAISFGGGCINNTLVHLGNVELPFGGVGNSGVGCYHGKYSFETFTRPKSILQTANWLDPSVKYPPFKGKLKYLKWLFR